MQSYQDNNHTVLRDVFWQEFSRILAIYSDQDEIYIGLSGGSSLDIFYEKISESLSSIDPDICSRLRFCLLDERIVAEDHPDSNLGQLRKKFLTSLVEERAISEDQIISVFPSLRGTKQSSRLPFPSSGGTKDLYPKYDESWILPSSEGRILENLPISYSLLVPRIDIALVGVGPDGHIASLFPHHPLLDSTESGYLEITDSPKPPVHRITVSPEMLTAVPYTFVAFMRGKELAYSQFLDGDISVADCPVKMLTSCDHLVVMSDIDE